MKKVDCLNCKQQHACCDCGVWVDLETAKKILNLGLKGNFYHLKKDKGFPSGYKAGTSDGDKPCSFLTGKGLCSIHKVDFGLKPVHCKEFPYDNGRLSAAAKRLCVAVKSKKQKSK